LAGNSNGDILASQGTHTENTLKTILPAALFIVVLVGRSLSAQQIQATNANADYPEARSLSSRKILDCFKKSNVSNCRISEFDAAEVLAKRGRTQFLIAAYEKGDVSQRGILAIALSKIKKPEVLAFVQKIAFENLTNAPDGEPRWYLLEYLAERCDQEALARLNREQNWKDSYPIGCMWWTGTVRQFGKCQYRAAIPHLIQYTNTVACLNISDAAVKSLSDLFPGKCKHSKTYNECHDCYQRLYEAEKRKSATGQQ
jgi:hypothetical protein